MMMKALVPLGTAAALILLCAMAPAQEKPAGRKTLTFQPGAKTPDAPAAAAAPAPQPVVPNALGIDEPGQAAALFFGLLQKNQVEEAYTGLMKGSKIAERPEELRGLKAKTTEAIEVFGAIQGFDLLETKMAGKHLMRRTYVSLGRDFPLRWRFYFYRIDGPWQLVDLRVDDRLGGIFEEPEESRAPSPAAAK
jgi:hypothetical protein